MKRLALCLLVGWAATGGVAQANPALSLTKAEVRKAVERYAISDVRAHVATDFYLTHQGRRSAVLHELNVELNVRDDRNRWVTTPDAAYRVYARRVDPHHVKVWAALFTQVLVTRL